MNLPVGDGVRGIGSLRGVSARHAPIGCIIVVDDASPGTVATIVIKGPRAVLRKVPVVVLKKGVGAAAKGLSTFVKSLSDVSDPIRYPIVEHIGQPVVPAV